MIQEKELESPLGYVRGCLKRGVKLEEWRLVLKDGMIWLENQQINVRIRNKTKIPRGPLDFEEFSVRTKPQLEFQGSANLRPITAENDFEKENLRERIYEARRGGLLGADRAGTW